MKRALLIDPVAQTITEHEYNEDWKTIAPTIGCHNFDVIFTEVGDIYVDDEGLLNHPEFFWMLDTMPHPIAGKALVFGHHDDEGDSTEVTVSASELKARLRFLTRDDVVSAFS